MMIFTYDVAYTYNHRVAVLLDEDEYAGYSRWALDFDKAPIRVSIGHGNDSTVVRAMLDTVHPVTRSTYDNCSGILNASSKPQAVLDALHEIIAEKKGLAASSDEDEEEKPVSSSSEEEEELAVRNEIANTE